MNWPISFVLVACLAIVVFAAYLEAEQKSVVRAADIIAEECRLRGSFIDSEKRVWRCSLHSLDGADPMNEPEIAL